MGIIAKIKDYVLLSAEEKVNKMYLENPDILLKKVEQSKKDALDRITETATRILATKAKWQGKLRDADHRMRSCDSRLDMGIREHANPDEMNSIAEEWQTHKRLQEFYTDGIKRLEQKYDDLVRCHNDVKKSYELQIRKVENAVCIHEVNKEILAASTFLSGTDQPVAAQTDVEDLIKILNEENNKVAARMKVLTDFGDRPQTQQKVEVVSSSALEEWKAAHASRS